MEQLVKRKSIFPDLLLPCTILAAALVCIWISLFTSPLLMILGGAIGGVGTFLLKRTNVEYEYQCLNGEIEIDKIFYKTKRKPMVTVKIEEIIVLAPIGHKELESYGNLNHYNYSSQRKEAVLYKAIVSHGPKKFALILELKKEMVEALQLKAPRKVFL